jgi:hypothetical protein
MSEQENPAADYVQGMAREMKRVHAEQKAHKKPNFWQRLAGVFAPASPVPHINSDGKLSTSSMTAAQLKARRMERIENARVGRPFHERVMLFCLKCWMLLGPIAFVCLTAAEVAYILTHLVSPGDKNGQVIIWAGAMFIELAMMFTTFGLGIKRHEVAERREAYGVVSSADQRLIWIGTSMWVAFALINIIGQSAFLLHVIASTHDPNMTLLYLFVASRVIGFILGDAGTAFFLGHVESNDVNLMARAEREKGKLYTDLAQAESERKLLEAEADSKIQLMEIKVQQERTDAQFLAQLKTQAFTRILELGGATQTALPGPSASSSQAPIDAYFYDDDYAPTEPTRTTRQPNPTNDPTGKDKPNFKRSDQRHT